MYKYEDSKGSGLGSFFFSSAGLFPQWIGNLLELVGDFKSYISQSKPFVKEVLSRPPYDPVHCKYIELNSNIFKITK